VTGPDEAFERTLGSYADALDAARNALRTDSSSEASIRRLAGALERSAGQHGFPAIAQAAKTVAEAPPSELAPAAERLLMSLLKAVTDPATREQAVLVVDDDVVLTRLLTKVLAHDHRSVLVAASGSEMLAILRTRWVDLIVLDVGLPDLDGREILSALRRNSLTANLPVVVLTAATEA
jgi:PleD family two-component response regulator